MGASQVNETAKVDKTYSSSG